MNRLQPLAVASMRGLSRWAKRELVGSWSGPIGMMACGMALVLAQSERPPGLGEHRKSSRDRRGQPTYALLAPRLGDGGSSRRFFELPNRVRKVGAVAPLSPATVHRNRGFTTHFQRSVRDLEDRHAGDGRFVWMEHAERRAIFEVFGSTRRVRRLAPTSRRDILPLHQIARARSSRLASRASTRLGARFRTIWCGASSFERSQVILREGGVEIRIIEAAVRS